MEHENGLAVVQPPAPTPAKMPVALVNGTVRINDIDQLGRMVKMISGSGWLPNGVNNDAQIGLILLAGLEVGLGITQSLQNIMVVNNRPTVWGDAALGLVRASGLLADIEETHAGEGDAVHAVCRVERKDQKSPIVRRFSVADAKAAKLWGKPGPWTQYPMRMLSMRARSFALRDGFADVLKGLAIREEVEDIPHTEPAQRTAVVVPQIGSAAASKLDALANGPTAGGAAGGGSQAPAVAAPPAPLDVDAIGAAMDQVERGKRPAFDADGNPIE